MKRKIEINRADQTSCYLAVSMTAHIEFRFGSKQSYQVTTIWPAPDDVQTSSSALNYLLEVSYYEWLDSSDPMEIE